MIEDWVKRFDSMLGSSPSGNCVTGDSGQQGFSGGRLNESYAQMYLATKDKKYLDRLVANFDASLAMADKTSFAQYPAGTPCWTSDRYTTDKKQYPFLVHDGFIWSPALLFVKIVRGDPALASYLPKAEGYLSFFQTKFLTRWDADYRTVTGGRGCFVMPKWQTHYGGIAAGQSLPFNMSETWALTLYRYSLLTGDTGAKAKAVAVATTLKTSFIKKKSGVLWRYAGWFVPTDNPGRYAPISDSSHAATDVYFMNELAKDGIVFTPADMAAVSYTFRTFVFNKTAVALHDFINGSDTSAEYNTELHGWSALARTDKLVPGIVSSLLNKPNNPYSSPRLAVASLALYDR